MTRNEKIHKLANAIKRYRGSYDPKTGKWLRAPQKMELGKVCRWLSELGINNAGSVDKIDGFKTLDAFNAWIRTV